MRVSYLPRTPPAKLFPSRRGGTVPEARDFPKALLVRASISVGLVEEANYDHEWSTGGER